METPEANQQDGAEPGNEAHTDDHLAPGADANLDPNTLGHSFVEVYKELRRLARMQLNRERKGHTLDSVALVNEAYLKLKKQDGMSWESKEHFFAMAARAMRTYLIDYARIRNAKKRGGGVAPDTFDEEFNGITDDQVVHLLELNEALTRLAVVNEESARLVECTFFCGLTMREAAKGIGMNYATARRRWTFAKVWLKNELGSSIQL